MTPWSELSQRGNHEERRWENLQSEWFEAPGSTVAAESEEEDLRVSAGV